MKQGWEIKKLGNACNFVQGIQKGVKLQSETQKENQVRFLRIVDFTQGNELPRYIDNPGDKYILKKNDVSLVRYGASTGFVCRGLEGALANNLFRVITKAESKLTNDYLFTFLTSPLFQGIIKRSMSGAAMPAISFGLVKDIPIPIPPLPEQKRIVSILDKAFAAIAKAKANAEQNLKNAKELFESYLQGVFENKGEDWEEKTLKEVFEIKPPKKEAKEKLKENDLVTFLPMADLGVLNKKIAGVQEKTLREVSGSYTYFADDDVLLAKITPCFENGKMGIARNLINGVGFGSSEYIVFRSKGNIEPDFLYYFLTRKQIREEGSKLMTGAVGHKRVSKDWIENYIILFPISLKEQQAIVQKLDALSAKTKKLEAIYQQKIDNLEELKKSVLQKAFNGELT